MNADQDPKRKEIERLLYNFAGATMTMAEAKGHLAIARAQNDMDNAVRELATLLLRVNS